MSSSGIFNSHSPAHTNHHSQATAGLYPMGSTDSNPGNTSSSHELMGVPSQSASVAFGATSSHPGMDSVVSNYTAAPPVGITYTPSLPSQNPSQQGNDLMTPSPNSSIMAGSSFGGLSFDPTGISQAGTPVYSQNMSHFDLSFGYSSTQPRDAMGQVMFSPNAMGLFDGYGSMGASQLNVGMVPSTPVSASYSSHPQQPQLCNMAATAMTAPTGPVAPAMLNMPMLGTSGLLVNVNPSMSGSVNSAPADMLEFPNDALRFPQSARCGSNQTMSGGPSITAMSGYRGIPRRNRQFAGTTEHRYRRKSVLDASDVAASNDGGPSVPSNVYGSSSSLGSSTAANSRCVSSSLTEKSGSFRYEHVFSINEDDNQLSPSVCGSDQGDKSGLPLAMSFDIKPSVSCTGSVNNVGGGLAPMAMAGRQPRIGKRAVSAGMKMRVSACENNALGLGAVGTPPLTAPCSEDEEDRENGSRKSSHNFDSGHVQIGSNAMGQAIVSYMGVR
ncbi:hypothetical protein GGI05_003074, partial [Coemansia sp. RSA 2603]